MQEKLRAVSRRRTILFGLVALILGAIVLWNGNLVARLGISFLSLYLMGTGLSDLFFRFVLRRKEVSSLAAFWRLLIGLGLDLLNDYTSLPLHTILLILGLYQLFMAFIYGVTYFLFRQNKIKGGFRFLLDTLIYTVLGLSTIIAPSADRDLQFVFLGFYLISLGLSNLRDGFFFDNDEDRHTLKRRTRISLPIVIAAFVPAERLNQFNRFLQGRKEQADLAESLQDKSWPEEAKEGFSSMEVFIHTSQTNFFGALGHVDICYQGQVISYGNYDPFSERLFGMVGDGVLFKVEREAYIDLCKKESQKTLFVYQLQLTKEQDQAIRERLAELDDLTYPWEPSSRLKDGKPIYPYHLKKDLEAEIYKFKDSRFKTYFVLSTNCVLLADSILGRAGTDIVDPQGIIAPGTYQAYLQYELASKRSLVLAETIY
ncbi:DUF308 domain-containing protein [Streptococcus oricebi]|uniref:DUF308 domain-containing protein n=1 Tax=Streptococcus oricebi TaxID=1547447 RepID=A0ABS5B4J0_9STRE|nr:DUF308 domain-containing protein [Streptococcus oricebi]MBP2623746.1 hypothetical protein [Streptococcus oricebi]